MFWKVGEKIKNVNSLGCASLTYVVHDIQLDGGRLQRDSISVCVVRKNVLLEEVGRTFIITDSFHEIAVRYFFVGGVNDADNLIPCICLSIRYLRRVLREDEA